MTTSYPIPKPLWDAIENVLLAKSNELIKDIAKTLNQPPRPLLDAFKAKKHTFHLVEMQDIDETHMECEAFVTGHAVAHRCRKPVLLGKKVCPEHEWSKIPQIAQKPIVRRIVTPEGETYFVDNLQNVYTEDFQQVGTFEDNVLTLFTVTESN